MDNDKKKLMFKYKYLFFKNLFIYGSLIIFIVGVLIGIFWGLGLLISSNAESIDTIGMIILSGFWFIISTWYITIFFGVLSFVYRNKLFVEKLTDKQIKKYDKNTEDIFWKEFIMLLSSMFYMNYISVWKVIYDIGNNEWTFVIGIILFFSLLIAMTPRPYEDDEK